MCVTCLHFTVGNCKLLRKFDPSIFPENLHAIFPEGKIPENRVDFQSPLLGKFCAARLAPEEIVQSPLGHSSGRFEEIVNPSGILTSHFFRKMYMPSFRKAKFRRTGSISKALCAGNSAPPT